MRDCIRHPSQSQPGDGVCASCLRERLVRIWRGESFRLVDDELASATTEVDGHALLAKPEPRSNGGDGEDGDGTATMKKPNVMVEWAEFQTQRRRRREQGTATSSRSLDSLELKPLVDRIDAAAARPGVSVDVPGTIRSRSMPMHHRRAEETALRVIREVQGGDLQSDELELELESFKATPEQQQQQRCQPGFCFLSSSPKWVLKLFMISSTTPSRNKKKVFPSRVGSRKRLTRFNSSDWSHPDAVGVTHWISSALPAKRGDEAVASVRSSVFSWLQDADRTMIRNYGATRERSLSWSAAESTDLWLREDLSTTVGHLHEIAEEELDTTTREDLHY